MADLKEETTVENIENTVEETVEEKKKAVDPSLEGIQLFYQKNKNAVNYIGGGALLLIAAFCFFKFYYLPDQETQALNEMYWADSYFEKDSFNIALKGGLTVNAPDGPKQMMGYEQIASEYSMTKAGSLASYCTGVCYLRTGKFDEAIPFLSKYDAHDVIIAPIALGAIGDCHLEMNRVDDAVKFYLKASEESKNEFTTPRYLKKAGFAYELKNNYEEALKIYERIQKEFPRSTEGRGIEKVIAKVKALGNL
ncbi:MAG: tetratricopeptide repeat protein [Bacteroidia bacterium]|nr:tetratricopeptide repeat protein [Bacteroidia bacterium]